MTLPLHHIGWPCRRRLWIRDSRGRRQGGLRRRGDQRRGTDGVRRRRWASCPSRLPRGGAAGRGKSAPRLRRTNFGRAHRPRAERCRKSNHEGCALGARSVMRRCDCHNRGSGARNIQKAGKQSDVSKNSRQRHTLNKQAEIAEPRNWQQCLRKGLVETAEGHHNELIHRHRKTKDSPLHPSAGTGKRP